MTPEERQLITGLFDRMRGFALPAKDAEAETLIKAQVGSLPDAPYMLVQSVLVQEHALQQADARIQALEEQVRALQQEAQQRAQPAPAGGSFLGGLFGGGRPEPERSVPERGASVPAVGARATPPAYGAGQPSAAQSAWGGPQQAPAPQSSPWAQQQAAPQAPMAGGGGFLRSAMTTAAGVAGGMLAANAISGWLNSGHAHTAAPAPAATPTPQPTQATAPDATPPAAATEASNTGSQQGHSPDYQEASYESDDGGWFGGDGGGDDFDI